MAHAIPETFRPEERSSIMQTPTLLNYLNSAITPRVLHFPSFLGTLFPRRLRCSLFRWLCVRDVPDAASRSTLVGVFVSVFAFAVEGLPSLCLFLLSFFH